MKINAINPFTINENNDSSKLYLCFNMNNNFSDGISKLMNYKKPVFIVPNPTFYWDSDFLLYQKTISDALSNTKLFYMDNKVKHLSDEKTNEKFRIIGAQFWNDFEGLNEELVTLSLIKSQNFQKIKADSWLENPENLKNFFEINENLKKNDIYYKIYKQYYKVGNFHPIISYLLYKENLNFVMNELNKPFEGKTILLTHNHPNSYGLYFEGLQVNSNSSNINNALGKQNNIDLFLSKKTSLEVLLPKGKIQHLIHGNSNKIMNYQYYNTKITSLNLSNATIDLDDEQLHIKNTLNYIFEENQKFVDLIRNSMINHNEIIKSTTDFVEFIKLYGFVFSLLNTQFFEKFFEKFNAQIIFINTIELNITSEELNSNKLDHTSLSEKIKYMLNIISKNHFTLQNVLNNMK